MVWKAIGDTDLPIAPANLPWDQASARERIFCWAGFDKPMPSKRARKAFFAYDQARANLKTAYRFPFADVVNGELVVVPEALRQVEMELSLQAAEGLPEELVQHIRRKIACMYRKLQPGLHSLRKGVNGQTQETDPPV
jgi:hypothetical protein